MSGFLERQSVRRSSIVAEMLESGDVGTQGAHDAASLMIVKAMIDAERNGSFSESRRLMQLLKDVQSIMRDGARR
jgi:hypothetical protein